jgi:hypothetical protein
MYIVPVRVINIRNWYNLPWGYESHTVSIVCQNTGMIHIFWSVWVIFSSRFCVVCDGATDRILNVGHQLFMVRICHSSQKCLRYACIFCKNIQWFRDMCFCMVVVLHCCIESLRFEVSRGALRVADGQAGVYSDCHSLKTGHLKYPVKWDPILRLQFVLLTHSVKYIAVLTSG